MVSGLPANLIVSAFGLVFVVAGLHAIRIGREHRAQSSEMAALETTAVRDLDPGPAEVKGTVEATGEGPIQSPLTETAALAYHVEVEEWESSGRGGNWQTVHEEETGVPILVDDGTGKVRVDLPSDGGLNLEGTRIEVESDEEPPEPVRRYVEDVQGLEIPDRQDYGPVSIGEPRRYREGVLEPGADAYVLGRAREAPSGDGELGFVIDEPMESGAFILSNKSERDLLHEETVGSVIYFAAGGLATVIGVFVVVVPWISP